VLSKTWKPGTLAGFPILILSHKSHSTSAGRLLAAFSVRHARFLQQELSSQPLAVRLFPIYFRCSPHEPVRTR